MVNLRPRLRPTAQISRQYYKGERWYVVRDAAGNQFHRLSDAAYRFVGLLDGTRTVGEAWDLVGGQLADDAPTQPEVIQILSQLYSANLVETDISPDAQVLLRRHKRQLERRVQGRLMNILFPRIPIWDPDRFLKRWLPLVGPFMSKWGLALWLAVVIGAIAAIAPEWQRLKESAASSIAPSNWLWLWAVFVLTKFIHELGHAFACRRFGGECHEMGIMFLVLIPTPYVDASTAWGFPNKWHRIFVGAAGMWIELFVAALCAFVWLATSSNELINQLAYNAMLIASVSTVLFNANPLLRYDGYYMLSDYLEIPNLQRRSSEYTLGLIKRHVFRVKPTQPLPPPMQRVQLFLYAILSTAYRIFVSLAIMLMVFYALPEELKVLGMIMGAGAIATFFLMPLGKLLKYLTIEPELHRKRGRAWAFTGAVAAAIVGLVGFVRVPVTVNAEGVTEAQVKRVVRMEAAGFVSDVKKHGERNLPGDGDWVNEGDILLVATDDVLETRIATLKSELEAARLERRQAGVQNQALANIADIKIRTLEDQLREFQSRQAKLTVRAPVSGYLIAPGIEDTRGRYLQLGEEIATIVQTKELVGYFAIDQRDAELVQKGTLANAEVRLASRPGVVLEGREPEALTAPQSQLRHALLGHGGGGEMPVDPRDPGGMTPLTRPFELWVKLDNEAQQFLPGQRAYIRVVVDEKPLAWQWWRRLLQVIQSQSAHRNA